MKKYTFISLFSILLFYVGCAQEKTFDEMVHQLIDESIPLITPEEIESPVIFLDAREQEEYDVSHIQGALYVGYKDFKIENVTDVLKDAKVVVYCSVGYRSEKVGEELMDAGFTDVSNLYGGIFYWVNSGNKVVDDQGETVKVHAYNKRWGKWLTEGEKVYEE